MAEGVSGAARSTPRRSRTSTRKAQEGIGALGGVPRHRRQPARALDRHRRLLPHRAIVSLRGTEACNAYYRLLRDELRDRVRRGIGGLREERHRLLWDNLPIWFAVRELSTLLASRGFNFVCTSYTNAWAEAGCRVDPADPLGSAARRVHARHPEPGPSRPARHPAPPRARLPGGRRRAPQRSLLQAVLDRPGRPEGPARGRARHPRAPPRGGPQRSARLGARAGARTGSPRSWRASRERAPPRSGRRRLDDLQGGRGRRGGQGGRVAGRAGRARASSRRSSGSWPSCAPRPAPDAPVGATGYGRKRVHGRPRAHRDHLPRARRVRALGRPRRARRHRWAGHEGHPRRARRRGPRLRHERQVRRRDRAVPRGDPRPAARAARRRWRSRSRAPRGRCRCRAPVPCSPRARSSRSSRRRAARGDREGAAPALASRVAGLARTAAASRPTCS